METEERPVSPTTIEPVTFPTRVDFWLAAVLGIALVVSFVAAVMGYRADPAAGWIGLAVISGAVLLVFLVGVPTTYVVGDRELTIRSGLIRTHIPLDSIERVYPTSNPLSAPAWSLDRLGIEYLKNNRRRLALISPVDQHDFLLLVGERAGLERVGAELIRTVPEA